MALISSLTTEILREVPKVIPALAASRLLLAAIEFCNKSRVWVQILTSFEPGADQRAYPLPSLPTDARVAGVKNVWQANLPLKPLQSDFPSTDTSQQASHYTVHGNDIWLYPLPNADAIETVIAEVELKPVKTATELDDDLWDEWSEELEHGAKGLLFTMSNQDWFNPELASYHTSKFKEGIATARIKAIKGGSNATIYTNPVAFGF